MVIVGAGPSGASCAYWLAEAGWDVVVAEKKEFPREKTCGDGLTPRAVRQLADMKGGIEFEAGDRKGIPGFIEYCGLCGWALALAHAKSGDAAMIAGYCGKSSALDEAMAKFALAYAKQTDRDHETLDKARRSGRIRVATSEVVK